MTSDNKPDRKTRHDSKCFKYFLLGNIRIIHKMEELRVWHVPALKIWCHIPSFLGKLLERCFLAYRFQGPSAGAKVSQSFLKVRCHKLILDYLLFSQCHILLYHAIIIKTLYNKYNSEMRICNFLLYFRLEIKQIR